jgi:hypothetical protein
VVEFFHHFIDVLIGYVLKTTAFGKVLPNQAIGVFVQASVTTSACLLATFLIKVHLETRSTIVTSSQST